MAQIRNVSGVDRYVPLLGKTVESDEVVTVDDDLLDGFVCQVGVWADEDAADEVAPPAHSRARAKKSTAPNPPQEG
jgi:hypothetical protein